MNEKPDRIPVDSGPPYIFTVGVYVGMTFVVLLMLAFLFGFGSHLIERAAMFGWRRAG